MTIGEPTERSGGLPHSASNHTKETPESTPEMPNVVIPDLEQRLSIATSPDQSTDVDELSRQRDQNDSPNSVSSSSSRPLHRNNGRLTSIARTAARATKEQFWDSNESGIVAAQTAVDRWEDAYVWIRNAVVASNRSVAGIYEASKAGVRGLDQGLLVPVRDYVLLPTFGVAEHAVSETASFLRSAEAERIRTAATKGSSDFISWAVPFGMGDSVVLPAVGLGAEAVKTAWDVARYPVPSQKRVRDTVDFWLNGSKHNLAVCGHEIIWYVRRADANIARTLRRTQWTVLGRGPYETLDEAARGDVMDHVCERYLSIGNGGSDETEEDPTALMVARYEYMANVRACNPSLYRDLVETGLLRERGGGSTSGDEWLSARPLYRDRSKDLFLLGETGDKGCGDPDHSGGAFALWFRLPYENGQRPKRDVPWVSFDHKEGSMLERQYRHILKQTSVPAGDETSGGSDSVEITNGSAEQHLPKDEQKVDSPWESAKYETQSKWLDPDFDRDILVDQKRHAVRFIRCCPKCRKRHTRDEEEAISRPLSELCSVCHPTEGERQAQSGEGFASGPQGPWGAGRLLAFPPPLLGLYRPTMWRSYGPDEIRRAVWFLDTPQNGPQPYGEDAQAMLEDAYHFLKWIIDSKRTKALSDARDRSGDDESSDDKSDENVLLTVQVLSPDSGEQQLVQFSSLTLATAIGRGLGGAIALFKRRVYRGAYNCSQSDDNEPRNDDLNRNVEDDSNVPVDDESRWTTTTEDALERLDLTIDTPESLSRKKIERMEIDLDYKECFKDLGEEQEIKPAINDSVDENEHQFSTLSESYPRLDRPSLAFPVKRIEDNLVNDDAECFKADHLILVIHGIGEMMKAFDLFGLKKVPTIVDCCGYLRDNHNEISDVRLAELARTNDSVAGSKKPGRVEYLPVEWHEAFSIQSTRRPSVDPVSPNANRRKRKVGINDISLRTIPNLRSFANDTLMDILYFMSPVHHDIIIDIVTSELNFIVKRFRTLTGFDGEISIIGHSLGSIVAWDILDHQKKNDPVGQIEPNLARDDDSYRYPQLDFQTDSVFLLGSPIPVFLMIRNKENPLTTAFVLSGCPKVFNIFHPYDPVSYRIEPLLNPMNAEIEPDIIIHWNGGFRFQYQTKRLWKKLVDQTLRAEENVIHSLESGIEALGLIDSTFTKDNPREDEKESSHVLQTGSLNGGRRIDYMLQEKEIETANEYVAALAAHSCYWLEKDLSLFIANEICLEKERRNRTPPKNL